MAKTPKTPKTSKIQVAGRLVVLAVLGVMGVLAQDKYIFSADGVTVGLKPSPLTVFKSGCSIFMVVMSGC